MSDPREARPANPPPLEQHTSTREFKVHGLDTKFYGRRVDLEALYNAIRDTVNNRQLHLVPVVGPAGVGKTRLVHEFTELIDIEARGISLLTTDSLEEEGSHSLRFTDQLLRQRFAISSHMGGEESREQIRRGLRGIVDDRALSDAVGLLAHLLSIPAPDGSRPGVNLPEDAYEQRALKTLHNLIRFDASRRPLILVLDSFQFAPDMTKRVVRELLGTLRANPVLALCLGRALLQQSDVPEGAEVRPIELGPLPEPVMTQILRHLLRRVQDLPDGLVEKTVQRAKGNPALLEDIVRLMLQRGILLDLGERWELRSEKLKGAQMPGTIGGAAKARVDGLAPRDRLVLEMAAIFGPVFWFGGILSMMRLERNAETDREVRYWMEDKKEARLNATLLEMQGMDLIEFCTESGIPDQVSFAFVNPIEQQRLHAEMVDVRRQMLHRVAAQWLREVVPAESFQFQEIVAFHYEQGGAPVDAAEAYFRAAVRARAAFQNRRAVDLYRRALDLYDVSHAARRCEILADLVEQLVVIGETQEAEARCLDMLHDSTVLGSKVWGGQAYLRLGRTHRARGQYRQAMDYFERAATLFEEAGYQVGIASCLDDIGRVHWYRGEYGSYKHALAQFLKSLALRRKAGDERAIAVSLGNIGDIQLGQAQIRQAMDSFQEALQIWRRLGDKVGVSLALVGAGCGSLEAGRIPAALRSWEEALEIAVEVGDRALIAMIQNHMGEAMLRSERLDDAEPLLGSAHQTAVEIGDRRTQSDVLRNKAGLARMRGHLDRALSLVSEALSLAESIEGKQLVGSCLGVQGDILADTLRCATPDPAIAIPDADKLAAKCYQRSISLFEEMGDNLRLAASMRAYGAFLMDRGVANKARKLLSRADEIMRGEA